MKPRSGLLECLGGSPGAVLGGPAHPGARRARQCGAGPRTAAGLRLGARVGKPGVGAAPNRRLQASPRLAGLRGHHTPPGSSWPHLGGGTDPPTARTPERACHPAAGPAAPPGLPTPRSRPTRTPSFEAANGMWKRLALPFLTASQRVGLDRSRQRGISNPQTSPRAPTSDVNGAKPAGGRQILTGWLEARMERERLAQACVINARWQGYDTAHHRCAGCARPPGTSWERLCGQLRRRVRRPRDHGIRHPCFRRCVLRRPKGRARVPARRAKTRGLELQLPRPRDYGAKERRPRQVRARRHRLTTTVRCVAKHARLGPRDACLRHDKRTSRPRLVSRLPFVLCERELRRQVTLAFSAGARAFRALVVTRVPGASAYVFTRSPVAADRSMAAMSSRRPTASAKFGTVWVALSMSAANAA